MIRACTRSHPYSIGARLGRAEAPISLEVCDTRAPVVVEDYSARPNNPPAYAAEPLRALAEFPILHGSTCLGVLSLSRTEPGRVFTPEEIERGKMLAQQTALVLHNAGIYADAVREAEKGTVALRESEERFRRIFEHSPITIVVASVPEGRFVAANEAASRMFGFSREEVIGKTTEEMNLWIDLEDRKRYLEILQRDRRVDGFETTLRKKSGEEINVLFSTAIMNAEGGNITSLVTVLDITARRRAEFAIRQFRAALDQSTDAVYLIDPDTGRFIDLNATAHARLGYSRDGASRSHPRRHPGRAAGRRALARSSRHPAPRGPHDLRGRTSPEGSHHLPRRDQRSLHRGPAPGLPGRDRPRHHGTQADRARVAGERRALPRRLRPFPDHRRAHDRARGPRGRAQCRDHRRVRVHRGPRRWDGPPPISASG